jgi:hypothetical protein
MDTFFAAAVTFSARKGLFLLDLKANKMVKWGIRSRAKTLCRGRSLTTEQLANSNWQLAGKTNPVLTPEHAKGRRERWASPI